MEMTKKQKIEALATAMTRSVRGNAKDADGDTDKEMYYHFTDTAPESLVSLYLEHYEVRDIDYETFSTACDIVSEIYAENPKITQDEAQEAIYERASDSASVYTATQLSYISIWNQDEIAQNVRELGADIGTAAAYWYDKQVEQAATMINDWVNE